jgi:hypothetical protein
MLLRRLAAGLALAALLGAGCSKCCLHPGPPTTISSAPPCCDRPAPPCCNGAPGGVPPGAVATPPPGATVLPPSAGFGQ